MGAHCCPNLMPLCFPDFPPVFHIKLKDQVLLEGEALTLCCLPAGSPTPRIIWMKGGGLPALLWQAGAGGALEHPSLLLPALPRHPSPLLLLADKRSLQPDNALNVVSCKDGRQMLTIAKVSRKDAGLYECAAANVLGTAISSCTLAVARKDEEGEPCGTEKSTYQAYSLGLGTGQSMSLNIPSLHLQKRPGLLRGDSLVLPGHLQHL